MSSDQVRRRLREVRQGLRLRRLMRVAVDALLAGLSAASLVLLLASGGWGRPTWALAAASAATALVALVMLLRLRGLGLADAGLHLDTRFALQERMCAAAAITPGRSVFGQALLDDAAAALQDLDGRRLLGPLLPSRTSYLAASAAIVLSLLLLVVPGDRGGSAGPAAGAGQSQPTTAASRPLPADAPAGGDLDVLLARLKEADGRLRATGSDADKAAVEALQAELEAWLAGLPQKRARSAGSEVEGAAKAAGGPASELARLRAEIARNGRRSPRGSAAVQAAPGPGPQWEKLAFVEQEIPPEYRAGVRAYMHALGAAER